MDQRKHQIGKVIIMEKAFDRMRLEMGQRIRILRKRQIWSQEEFAEKLGVSTITISRIENGTTRIDVQLLMNMAEVLRTKVTTILGTEEDEFIEVYEFDREKAYDMVINNEICDSKTVIGLLLTKELI